MSAQENTEDLVRSISFKVGPEMDRRVWADTLGAYRSYRETKPAIGWIRVGRIVPRSPITRSAASVALVLGVLAAIYYTAGSVDGAREALGQVHQALARVPWMHVQGQIDAPWGQGQADEWICFKESIEITKAPDGVIRYHDEGRQMLHVYDPTSQTVTITSLTDRYAVPRRAPLPLSTRDALESLMKTLNVAGDAETSVTGCQTDGRSTEVVHVITRLKEEGVGRQDVTITMDAESKLPLSMDSVVLKEDGTVFARLHAVFDYPQEGPRDLYAIGVPQDASVVDRRPHPEAAATAQIHRELTTDPQNPGREILRLTGAVQIDLVKVPPGEFLMGSPDTEIGYPARFLERFGDKIMKKYGTLRPLNEGPQHRVRISRAFYLSKCEITCDQFRRFQPEFRTLPWGGGSLRGKSRSFATDLGDQPACVSLEDAIGFCQWLTAKTGLKVRLPSEAEWEYACRAGTQTRFYWGDAEEDAGRYANVADRTYESVDPGTAYSLNTDDGSVGPAAVGRYLPNGFGLYDMIGNAPEWVQGVYSENAFSIDPQNKAFEANGENGQVRYSRGDGWRGDIIHCRCASRWEYPPHAPDAVPTKNSSTGFRLLIDQE